MNEKSYSNFRGDERVADFRSSTGGAKTIIFRHYSIMLLITCERATPFGWCLGYEQYFALQQAVSTPGNDHKSVVEVRGVLLSGWIV